MKPLTLIFSGLHSYRTRQEVDFTELSAAGLFGIFGPTGAGKSTVLDAITLALYGSVDRAKGGKTGIINQLEDSLSVSFSFELGTEVWRIEREYRRKKNDPEGIQVQQARLIQIAGDKEQVVASTASDVDARVIEILGLRREDFTRAVVLPQGKFDAFLRLTAGDRAKMLEYIFALDDYGEVLVARTRAVRETCEEKILSVAAELASLGDATPVRVEQAREEVAAATQAVKSWETKSAAAEKRFQELDELRRLWEAYQEAEQRQAALTAELPAQQKKLALLAAAQRAEPLRDRLQREQELEPIIDAATGKVAALEHEFAAAQQEADRAAAELAAAIEYQQQEGPALQDRVAELKEALRLALQRKKLLEEQEQTKKDWLRVKQELDKTKEQEEQNSQRLRQLETELTELVSAQDRLALSAEEEERWQRAGTTLQALRERERQLKTWSEHYDKAKRQLAACKAALWEKLAERLAVSITSTRTDALQQAEAILTSTSAQLEKALESRAQVFLNGQAAALAVHLKSGEPCPVCGSTDHPNPASPGEYEAELADANACCQEAEEKLKEVQSWFGEVRRLALELEAEERSLDTNLTPGWQAARAAVEECQAELRGLVGDLSREELEQRLRTLAQQARERQRLEKLRRELEAERDNLLATSRDLAGIVAAREAQLSGLKGEGVARANQIKNLEQELDKISAGKDPAKLLQETQANITALEKKIEQARVTEDRARATATRLQSELAGAQSRLETLADEVNRLKTELEAALLASGFSDRSAARAALLPAATCEELRRETEDFGNRLYQARMEAQRLKEELAGRVYHVSEWETSKVELERLRSELNQARVHLAVKQRELDQLEANQQRFQELEQLKSRLTKRRDLAATLGRLVSGRRFVEFLAEEYLADMAVEASRRLGALTGQRYALELGDRAEFVLRDDYAGGQRRPVTSLSGGETFLTSLALALALSSQLQLKGRYPLGFFFLDEGFGSLDGEKLEVVLQALEKMRLGARLVGVISHVAELRERIPIYLEVIPAEPDGSGSYLKLIKK
ncbi:MAG: AAA family ATPase [bacterium]|jgi:exonuclease SbcC